MKSKRIPVDIEKKSIEDAEREIKEIIEKLEKNNANLEDSTDQYNRMMMLNNHIQEKFKEKANQIKQSSLKKNKKNLSKDLK